MDVPLLREAGTRLGINSRGKLRGHVDYEPSDFYEARRWLRARFEDAGIASDGGDRNP
jgi:hypothetical protein